jgi:hypothetical protein
MRAQISDDYDQDIVPECAKAAALGDRAKEVIDAFDDMVSAKGKLKGVLIEGFCAPPTRCGAGCCTG